MTQGLILGVLLTGLVGLIWVITVSILAGDHPTPKSQNPGTSSHSTADDPRNNATQRTMAA